MVFDHDQAYHRVKRSRCFWCLVPVLSPGGVVRVAGEQHHVPSGCVVSLEAWHLLFGEGGAVAGYCLPARTVAAIIAKVLRLPPGHYIDNFIAALLAADDTAVTDLGEFLVDILKFVLQRKKLHSGRCLLCLSMEIRFSDDGNQFVITENRRRKYVELL